MKHLREFLETPKGGHIPSGAKEDLNWLNRQNDLSSVKLGAAEQQQQQPQHQMPNHNAQPPKERDFGSQEEEAARSKKGGGGFAALFNCAGRRK